MAGADPEAPLLPKQEPKGAPGGPWAKLWRNPEWANKFLLAVSTGFWMTLFYVPVVSPTCHYWLFEKMNVSAALASPDFESYWPNTVQLAFFTIYFSTGSTVNLAWQGMIGTFAAGVNQVMMGKLFPYGGKCVRMGPADGGGIRGFCEEYYDPNYGTFVWFVWLDFFLFIFVILASNSQENTMKFGLSWHMFYMMAFMSPTGYQPSHAVTITTVIGAILAILVTLVPSFSSSEATVTLKNVTVNRLEAQIKSIGGLLDKILSSSAGFVLDRTKLDAAIPTTHEERYKLKATKFAIEQMVDRMPGLVATVQEGYKESWWEGWLYMASARWFRDVRSHSMIITQAFGESIGGFDDALGLLKKSVLADDPVLWKSLSPGEAAEVKAEREQLIEPVRELNEAMAKLITDLMEMGESDEHRLKNEVDAKSSQLRNTYRSYIVSRPVRGGASKQRRDLRVNLSCFVFALLALAQKLRDLAETVLKQEEAQRKADNTQFMVDAAWGMLEELKATWMDTRPPTDRSPLKGLFKQRLFFEKALLDHDKRGFVLRNLFSIGICFLMGNFLQGNVFTPFNPALASTLAVLISHYPGSAFYKNLMRLLGLTLGNALPIIILAFVSLFGKASAAQTCMHLLMFFLFEAYFALMYYTSPEWAYVGAIVAGFGCYSFVGTQATWSEGSFEAGYMKIGQVTAAIFVQIVVDTVDTAQRAQFPRDIVVRNLERLIHGDGEDGIIELFEKTLDNLTSKDVDDTLSEKVGVLKGIMASQEALVAECADKTVIVRGPMLPFKYDLYVSSLKLINDLLAEMDNLCLVEKYSATLGDERMCHLGKQFESFSHGATRTMKGTLSGLLNIFKQTDTTLIDDFSLMDTDEDPAPARSAAGGSVEDLGEVLAESAVGGSVGGIRVDVVKRILDDTLEHVMKIEKLCCSSGALKLD